MSDLEWSERGPRSRRFDDVYFSTEDGLGESRAVFLDGCGLPDAWAGRGRFVLGELGFGTGLNIAAAVDLWRRTGPPAGRLHIFSVEAFVIPAEAAARALGAWPELAPVTARLLAAWPGGRRGVHRIELADWRVVLDLAVAEVVPALAEWDGRADAWFLDGFSPARNPQMWSPEVLRLVAERCAPGARLASFTVAGAVRRELQAAGLAVERRPGFGRKRDRLEARAPGLAADPRPPSSIAVIGAGVAGAALARACSALGMAVTVVEAAGAGAGASGNPAALVTPRLDAGLGPVAALYAQAFARAIDLYRSETPGAIVAKGALQLERQPRDPARFATVAAWDGFDPGALSLVDAAEVAAGLGETPGPGALAFRNGLVVEPAAVLAMWLDRADRLQADVVRLEPLEAGWRLWSDDGPVCEVESVVLAAGHAAVRLRPDLPVRPVRGQASWAEGAAGGPAAAWGGYAIATRGGVLFGATHDRGDDAVDLRPEDHARNLALLAQGRPALAAALSGVELRGRAGVRGATPDHLPLAGELAPGLWVLAGLGGRGFTLAPLLGEHVAALLVGAPSPLPIPLATRVDPGRFGRKGLA